MKFVAIDFETANYCAAGICAAGAATFEDGTLTDSKYWLIRPPKGAGWFHDKLIAVHGITHETVRKCPEFPEIAPEFFARVAAADIVIAHHASFDMRKLRATAKHFRLEIPPFDSLCTLALARAVWPKPLLPNYDLATVAAHIGHQFRHHHAGEDAEAAGRILLAMMQEKGVVEPRALAEMVGVQPVMARINNDPNCEK